MYTENYIGDETKSYSDSTTDEWSLVTCSESHRNSLVKSKLKPRLI